MTVKKQIARCISDWDEKQFSRWTSQYPKYKILVISSGKIRSLSNNCTLENLSQRHFAMWFIFAPHMRTRSLYLKCFLLEGHRVAISFPESSFAWPRLWEREWSGTCYIWVVHKYACVLSVQLGHVWMREPAVHVRKQLHLLRYTLAIRNGETAAEPKNWCIMCAAPIAFPRPFRGTWIRKLPMHGCKRFSSKTLMVYHKGSTYPKVPWSVPFQVFPFRVYAYAWGYLKRDRDPIQ